MSEDLSLQRTGPQGSPLSSSRKKAALEEQRVLRAGSSMERALPAMVRYLEEKFYDESCDENGRPVVSVKEKTGIFRAFSANVALRPRIEKRLGIGEKGNPTSQNPLIVAVGGNIAVFKSLPPEKRRELLLKLAAGETTDAAQEGKEQGDVRGEHPGAPELGLSDEAGPGHRVQPEAQGQEEVGS